MPCLLSHPGLSFEEAESNTRLQKSASLRALRAAYASQLTESLRRCSACVESPGGEMGSRTLAGILACLVMILKF